MKFKKLAFVLFSLFLLSIAVMGASADFYDNFESYNDGNIDTVTSGVWNCSNSFSSDCQVKNYSTLQGSKTGYVKSLSGGTINEARRVFTDSFSGVDSGLFNFWVFVDPVAQQGDGDYIILTNSSANPSSSNILASIHLYSASAEVWNGSSYVAYVKGAGESYPSNYYSPHFWRVKVNFDTNVINYYQYDSNKNYLSSHTGSSIVLGVDELKFLMVQAKSAIGDTNTVYFDQVQLDVGNSVPSVSNVDILPSSPDENDTLSCSYSFYDADVDVDVSKIVWRVNNIALSFFENSSYLPAGNSVGGDVVSCSVTAFDGSDFGNTDVDSVILSGGVLSLEETVLSVELDDEVNIGFDIYGLDFDTLSGLYGGFVGFIGRNASSNILGYVELFQPNQYGNIVKKVVEDSVFSALSVYENIIWVASDEGVLRYRASSSLPLLNNFSSSGEIYLDVVARNDSSAFACYEYGGSEALVSFNVNNSGLFDLDLLSIGCRGLEYYRGDILYVDSGLDGVTLVNVSDLESLSSISTWDSRLTYFWGGRHDVLEVYNNVLFTDNGDLTGFTLDVSNPSSPSYPNTICDFPSGSDSHFSIEPYNESLMFSSNLVEGDLYMCDYVSGSSNIEAFKLYDNPSGSSASYDLILFQEAGQNYLYGSTGQDLQIYRFFVSSQSVNQLPSFFETTPDSQYVDNLNPISTNVTPLGVETPTVNVYPLACLNPNLYDCSFDVDGDTIYFAIDKDNDGVIDVPYGSVENKFVTYDEAGLFTLRIYLTDSEHLSSYSVFRDFVINVSGTAVVLGANQTTLRFLSKDSSSNGVLSGVSVSVNNVSSGFTNSDGLFVSVVDEGVYLVSFSKSDYYDRSNYFSSSIITYEVFLDPVIQADKRTLIVDVKNDNGTLLQNIFVELYMPITQSFDFKVTDASGRVIFNPDEDNVVLTIQKDGYDTQEVSISVPLGSVVNREVFLEFESVSRGGSCQDYLANTWLCGYNNVSCSIDSDCITGMCGFSGTCSGYNWTLCDVSGMDRGNRCVIKYTFKGVASAVGDWVLDNFFYVLIIILFALFLLVFSLKNN